MSVVLKSRIPAISVELARRADKAAREGAEMIEAEAERRVSVRFGDLRESIHVEKLGVAKYAVVAGGRKGVFYGHLLEFGTDVAPPHPFLVPATEAKAGEVVKHMQDEIKGL